MEVREGDRCVSWLPFYHDMGLVGCLLSPVANQVSADYLKTEDFARRPLAWLDLISRNEGTTLSYSPTFGYDICARRVSSQMDVAERFDLSRWRVAGNGADMIRPDVMQCFVDTFRGAGFDAKAFLPATVLPRPPWPCPSCRRAKASSSSWSRKPLLAAAPAASATGRSVTGRSSIAAAPRAA
jgi:acyl-CoA synthetase (AMP-forming)/AMP-acid ligase II